MKLTTFFSLILLLFIPACTDRQDPGPSAGFADMEDTSGPELARRLSVMIRDMSTRVLIREQLLEQFDGDYNFLFAMTGQAPEKPGSQLFSRSFSKRLHLLTRQDPLLQLAMPDIEGSSASDWDAESFIPIVVYRPPGVDLSQLKEVPAFRNGTEFRFNIEQLPEEPILVVSHNERVAVFSKTAKGLQDARLTCTGPLYEDEDYSFYLKKSLRECDYASGNGSTTPVDNSGCDRANATGKDYLLKARFATMEVMRKAESYLDGNPEVYFIVTLASKNPSGFSSLRKSFISTDRSQWKNCGIFSCVPQWRENNMPVFQWDKSLFGELVRYDWFEEDYSTAKIDLSLGLSTKIDNVSVSGSAKVTINKSDFFLDQDFVGYCDATYGEGTEYNTGKFLFRVNQH